MSVTAEVVKYAGTIVLFGQAINIYALMILTIFCAFMIAFYRAYQQSKIDWVDLITDVNQTTGQREASTTKILQLIGGITATFVVIKLTLQNSLTWDVFGIYLVYVASIDSFARFMLAKYGVNLPSNQKPPGS